MTPSADTRPPTPAAALGDAVVCWLGAVLLTALAVAAVFSSSSCESACPSVGERLLPGAILLALTWIPLTPASAVLLRRRGHDISAFSWTAGAIGVVLTSYQLAVGGLAWALVSDRTIHGPVVWGIYCGVTIVGWIALALVLVAVFARR